ncbi:MAG: hypothetical protein K0U39_05420 [Alphaproteobacteria bacterium]|nr:hypothetical protein [Alphaproteobacteria bacterium]
MKPMFQRGMLLLAILALTACGNKVAVQHPDNKPFFSYPAIEEEEETQFPVTNDASNNDDERQSE